MLMRNLLMVVAMSTVAASAYSDDAARAAAQKTIELKNGSTLFIFKDGKAAVEDKYGRAVRMKKGAVMETKDGEKLTIQAGEVMRLDSLIKEGHGHSNKQ